MIDGHTHFLRAGKREKSIFQKIEYSKTQRTKKRKDSKAFTRRKKINAEFMFSFSCMYDRCTEKKIPKHVKTEHKGEKMIDYRRKKSYLTKLLKMKLYFELLNTQE